MGETPPSIVPVTENTKKGVISVTGIWDPGLVKGTRAIEQAYAMGKNA